MLVEQIYNTGLGHASYLVADPEAGVAFLVDPERDVEPYLEAARRLGVLVTHSFETHVHNDYLTGSAALAALRPITVVAGAEARLGYAHLPLTDGATVDVGALSVRCIATPGHTPEHVSYLVADLRRADEPQYLFSGGALLVGHIARVDLLGPEMEATLSRAAYDTLRERVLPLPDHLAVFPTHGGGSACTGAAAGSRWTTLGFERRHNRVAVAAASRYDDFRTAISDDLPEAPAYYPFVRAWNARGPALPQQGPLPVLDERALRSSDAVLVDPRPPHVFGAGHRPGAINVVGNESFGVRVGAVVPFGRPIVLLTEDADQGRRLRGDLALVGYDEVRGLAGPLPAHGQLERVEQLDPPAASARATAGALLLDVRGASEWREGHAPGAVHLPYERLPELLAELPAEREVVTYCGSGIRSSLAASVLQASGRRAANVRGGFAAWRAAGLPVVVD
ncbi:MAG TPA: MBL fold metallo-hydrolase [Candidatus Limnocylindrales bacterium]|nr:MBL fold metallo-hydrolase [Candidatus Limnocylindrales bacterium]